jgi:hypothetical protein
MNMMLGVKRELEIQICRVYFVDFPGKQQTEESSNVRTTPRGALGNPHKHLRFKKGLKVPTEMARGRRQRRDKVWGSLGVSNNIKTPARSSQRRPGKGHGCSHCQTDPI